MQSVSSGSSGGGGGSGSGSGSSSSSSTGGSSTVGTAAQIMTTVISCLMGRVLLLEIFMAAVLTSKVNLGEHSSFFIQ